MGRGSAGWGVVDLSPKFCTVSHQRWVEFRQLIWRHRNPHNDHKIEGGPSVFFDAVAVLPSVEGGAELALSAEAVNFVCDAYP